MGRLDAILQANKDCLRPILMTTAAFVAGMVQMKFANGIGASMNTTIAGVIIGVRRFRCCSNSSPRWYSTRSSKMSRNGAALAQRSVSVGNPRIIPFQASGFA